MEYKMSFIVNQKSSVFLFVFTVTLVNDWFLLSLAQTTSTVTGSKVQLNCKYTSGNGESIIWSISNGQPLTENINIYDSVPTELRHRLNITGAHSNGEYNLMLSGIQKSDEGNYECSVYPGTDKIQVQTLVVIDGPTGLNIINKQENKLVGTEGQDLIITCTANGGDPAPDMTLLIGSGVYRANNQHTIQYTVARVSRSFDGATVTCQAGYEGVTYTPMNDTAMIELNLKPLTPSFSMDPVVTENTKSLILNCISTGSRPFPTERIWLIGDSNVTITSNSTSVSSTKQPNGTYTSLSTLMYKVSKDYNQQNITCGFKNIASGNTYVLNTIRMNVKYAPLVTVSNKTFNLTQTSREIQCKVDGNPFSTFSRWQHRSKYGKLIREFDGGSILKLPQQLEEISYQDTGEYVCTASNGIEDDKGNLNQKGSGYVVGQAPPRFLNGSSQLKLGQYGEVVNIDVSVYSEPKYNTPIWLKDGRPLSQSTKYTMSDVSDILTDKFYDKKVQVDGFILGLTIKNLEEGDFVNYTLRLSNGVGGTVTHLVELQFASPPLTPTNFTIIGSTDTTVTLQWVPGFDGGHEQTFIVEYRTEGSKNWKSAAVPNTAITLQDEPLSYKLPGLDYSTSYEIRMYAENNFNKSLPTASERISTKVSAESSGQGAVIGAVGGTIVMIVIILSIVAVVIVWRRRDGNEKKKLQRSDSDSDGEDGLKDNILYKSVDTGSSKPPEAAPSEYAEEQKPSDVYAEVSKPKQQKDTKEKKQKGKKSLGNRKQKPKAVNNNSAEVCANKSEYGNVGNPTGGYKNADGLQYADIAFSNPPKTKPGKPGKPVIHGLEDRTVYCDVDHSKKAPPLPQEGAYELTDICKGKQS